VNVLTAPGAPVELRLRTPAGEVNFRATSYLVNIRTGHAQLTRPRITDPSGKLLASADHVVFDGLDLLRGSDQVFNVQAWDVYARVVRLRNGRFQLQDLLPKGKAPSNRVPFNVVVRGAEVDLVDEESPKPYVLHVSSDVLNASGLSDDWVAAGAADVSGVGSVSANVTHQVSGRTVVATQTNDLELAGLLNHLKSTPEAKKLGTFASATCGSLRVTGPITVAVLPGGKVGLRADVRSTAKAVAYRGYALDAVSFTGQASETGAQGAIVANVGTNRATFNGAASWIGKPVASGAVTAQSASEQAIPSALRKLLPPGLAYRDGAVTAWISADSATPISAYGSVTVGSVAYRGEHVSGIQAQIEGSPDRVRVAINKATYQSEPITGTAQIDRKSKSVLASVRAESLDLHSLAARFKVPGLAGRGEMRAIVSGSLQKPSVAFDAGANGVYTLDKGHIFQMSAQATGTYADGGVHLERAVASGPVGDVFVFGDVHTDHTIAFNVVGREIHPEFYDSHVKGLANLEGTVSGTLQKPFASGRAEAYALDVDGQDIPLVTTDFYGDLNRVHLTGVQLIKGTTVVGGEVSLNLHDLELDGSLSAKGVQLADYIPDSVIGAVDANSLKLSGKLSEPIVTGHVTGTSIVVEKVKIDNLDVTAEMDGPKIAVTSGSAQIGKGNVQVTGGYDVGAESGHLNVVASALSLADLSAGYSDLLSLGGTVEGNAQLDIRGPKNPRLAHVAAKGNLRRVVLNGTTIGDGPWTVSGDEDRIEGTLDVGQLDRFLSISNFKYDFGKEEPSIAGHVDIYNFDVQDMFDTASRYWPNLSYDAYSALKSAEGQIDASIEVSGKAKNPFVDVQTVQGNKLSIYGQGLGTLNASFSRSEGMWDVHSFSLTGGPGSLTLSGTVDEQGEANVDGDLVGLDLSKLGGFDSRLVSLTGTVSSSFRISGKTETPEVLASLSARGLFADRASTNEDRSLRLELYPVKISQSTIGKDGEVEGGIVAAGDFFFTGFEGKVSAHAPLKYPGEIPDDQKIEANVLLAERDLGELAQALNGIDTTKTKGTVKGKLTVGGSISNLDIEGGVQVDAKTIAATGYDETLNNVTAGAKVAQNTLSITAKADGSYGGSVQFDLKGAQGDLGSLVSRLRNGGVDSALSSAITGAAQFDKLKMRKDFPGRTYVASTVSGSIGIGGTVRRPSLDGSLTISDLDSAVPALNPAEEEPAAPTINPTFDVNVNLGNPAHLRAVTADMYLTGGGTLKGTLAAPVVAANLTVDKGQLRLPSALIRLDQGGTVALNYQSLRNETVSRLNVDVTGRTSLTAPGLAADTIQRYDITLGVRGDLLSDNGLELTASSDPPDLSQDQILAKLGQSDVLTSLNPGSGVSRSDAQRQVQSAMIGFAVPSLFDSFTSSVAKSLGLDYLEIGYSAYAQATFSFAKSLGAELTFQGTHEVTQPPPGYPFQYDYRLIFHPRRAPGILRRLSLSLGTDQDRPYKIGLEYGTRF
jgi:autotransporter translocation and assembly factor TamB